VAVGVAGGWERSNAFCMVGMRCSLTNATLRITDVVDIPPIAPNPPGPPPSRCAGGGGGGGGGREKI